MINATTTSCMCFDNNEYCYNENNTTYPVNVAFGIVGVLMDHEGTMSCTSKHDIVVVNDVMVRHIIRHACDPITSHMTRHQAAIVNRIQNCERKKRSHLVLIERSTANIHLKLLHLDITSNHRLSTMRSAIFLLSFAAWAAAFAPVQRVVKKSSQLDMVSRRDAIGTIMAGIMIPQVAHAFSQQLDDYAYEPQQQATDGKWDLNSVFVGDYKYFPGMFPTSAGKIASNGPYKKVKDIYKIPGLTENDIKNFKKYEQYFTVNPPGRSFYERINNRVST